MKGMNKPITVTWGDLVTILISLFAGLCIGAVAGAIVFYLFFINTQCTPLLGYYVCR